MLCLVLGWLLVPPPALEETKTHSWIFYKSSLLIAAEQVWQILQLRPADLQGLLPDLLNHTTERLLNYPPALLQTGSSQS